MSSDQNRDHIIDALTATVRGGFRREPEIVAYLDDIVARLPDGDHPGLTEELTAFVRELTASEKAAEADWDDVTTNDALDRAFAELRGLGIVALQNAGLTQSDGWSAAEEDAGILADELDELDELDENEDFDDDEDFGEDDDAEESPWGRVRGAVFYHGQDLARAVRGDGLYLTFGAFSLPGRSRADHDEASVAVGRTVRDVLARHGVAVTWDETVAQRILVPPFTWRRRRWTQAPTA
ncbi:hypothetical protein LO772_05880 [Yinghuangia sp. ASG 101]|uniref:DUF6891 domain-containing protein n=1 Tax=Yinghuangia sp. ASG 101 TaxID=2896848 RepID=UPI001E46ACD1|nr:hypothetical protein [Yinghuangia sp. ASG 101]UGQ13146.1 hypothetical protein LO772_05880 [Yinghuangia sp. ASG 101]